MITVTMLAKAARWALSNSNAGPVGDEKAMFDLTKHLRRSLRPYELSIPDHFDLERTHDITVYQDLTEIEANYAAAEDWKRTHNISSRCDDDHGPHGDGGQKKPPLSEPSERRLATHDTFKTGSLVTLAIIDDEGDFNLNPQAGGKLSVFPQSVDNLRNLIAFILINMRIISDLVITLDVHHLAHIFSPIFWVDELGNHPAPYTRIAAQEVGTNWHVNPYMVWQVFRAKDTQDKKYLRKLEKIARAYCQKIEAPTEFPHPIGEREGYMLEIWPTHVRLGSFGMALMPSLLKAVDFFDIARWSKSSWRSKGSKHLLSEEYSPFGNVATRVTIVNDENKSEAIAVGESSDKVIDELLNCHMLIIAGQALSHCVLEAIYDIIRYILKKEKIVGLPRAGSFTRRIFILKDCCSPVALPVYEERVNKAFLDFKLVGVNIIEDSTIAMEQWPNLPKEVKQRIAQLNALSSSSQPTAF